MAGCADRRAVRDRAQACGRPQCPLPSGMPGTGSHADRADGDIRRHRESGSAFGRAPRRVFIVRGWRPERWPRVGLATGIGRPLAAAMLVYAPGVWWVSHQIRGERELCCDDLAVAASGDVLTYARALAELESCRPAHRSAALAANGGSLMNRIGRLLGQPQRASHTLPGVGAACALSILLLG